jgi:hypothetical protein
MGIRKSVCIRIPNMLTLVASVHASRYLFANFVQFVDLGSRRHVSVPVQTERASGAVLVQDWVFSSNLSVSLYFLQAPLKSVLVKRALSSALRRSA